MKQWIKKIWGFGLASFFSDVSHEMTVSLIPIIVGQFVGPAYVPFALGVIASISDAFASFLRLFSGVLSDRIARKKPLIALGYAMSGFFSMLVGFAHSASAVLMYRMLSFAGSGLREPPRDALIAATIDPAYYGRAFGLRNAMDTVGSLVGPLIALVCLRVFSIKSVFLLSCVPGILSVVAIIYYTQDIPVPATSKPREWWWHSFALLPRSFVLFVSIFFVFELGCFDKLLLLARTQELLGGSSTSVASMMVLLYALFNASRACAEYLIGWLGDMIDSIVLLAVLGCGVFIALSLLLCVTHASLLYCMLVFVLSGVSTATTYTLKKSCAAHMLPSDMRGTGYGFMQAMSGMAALFAHAFIGFLWTWHTAQLGFGYAALCATIAMGALLFFKKYMNVSTRHD